MWQKHQPVVCFHFRHNMWYRYVCREVNRCVWNERLRLQCGLRDVNKVSSAEQRWVTHTASSTNACVCFWETFNVSIQKLSDRRQRLLLKCSKSSLFVCFCSEYAGRGSIFNLTDTDTHTHTHARTHMHTHTQHVGRWFCWRSLHFPLLKLHARVQPAGGALDTYTHTHTHSM